MSGNLTDRGYVAGYNTPITEEVYNKLGYKPPCNTFPKIDNPTYDEEQRAIIYKRYHPKMTDLD